MTKNCNLRFWYGRYSRGELGGGYGIDGVLIDQVAMPIASSLLKCGRASLILDSISAGAAHK